MNKQSALVFIARASLFGITILILLALSPIVRSHAANETAALVSTPETLILKTGETSTLEIKVEQVQDLYGIELHLLFDPQMIEVIDSDVAKDGVQIKAGDWLKTGFSAQNNTDNQQGKLDFAATLLNPAEPLQGSINLVNLTVRAKAEGKTSLALQSAILASREGASIPYTWQESQITVTTTGQAQTSNTGGTGNADNIIVLAAVGGVAALLLAGVGFFFVLRSGKKQV